MDLFDARLFSEFCLITIDDLRIEKQFVFVRSSRKEQKEVLPIFLEKPSNLDFVDRREKIFLRVQLRAELFDKSTENMTEL